VPIFEDTELSLILRSSGQRPVRLPEHATTSAVRFRRNGALRQLWLNQKLKLAYHLGLSRDQMNRIYEQGLGLNTRYPDPPAE
jgi:hypothetical protein